MTHHFNNIKEAKEAIRESVFGRMVNVEALAALFNFLIEAALDRRAALEEKSEDLPEFLTKKQVASYLSCSQRTVDNRIEEGLLSVAKRVGKRVYFHRTEVEKIFKE